MDNLNLQFKDEHFGMFIVLKLHRESLRKMINQGRASHLIRLQVLRMLESQVCSGSICHGDIKDFLVFDDAKDY